MAQGFRSTRFIRIKTAACPRLARASRLPQPVIATSCFEELHMSSAGFLWIWLLGAPMLLALVEMMRTPRPRR
jgi:hypothetical protein